jgi:hypothetical protein
MDDILVIYNATKTNPHYITTYINKIHNNIKLNFTYETHNSIDILHLTIWHKQANLKIDIYRKLTTTSSPTIPQRTKWQHLGFIYLECILYQWIPTKNKKNGK